MTALLGKGSHVWMLQLHAVASTGGINATESNQVQMTALLGRKKRRRMSPHPTVRSNLDLDHKDHISLIMDFTFVMLDFSQVDTFIGPNPCIRISACVPI